MLIDVVLSTVSYALWSLTSIFTMLPSPKENVTITYTLYTPDNPNPTIIENINELVINPEYELKILCHGWSYQNYSTQWYNYTVKEYLKRGGINVITANYTSAIMKAKFYTAIKYASSIGSQIGNFVLKLEEFKAISFDKVHILGHLLGAHIAGVAGETIYKETGKNIDRITGLDPSSFGIFKMYTDGRLSRNDAEFVDVIHASSDSYYDPIGRIDFFGYPYMTKCSYNWFKSGHMGPTYYANSINNAEEMVGTKCLKRKFYFSWTRCNENVTTILGEHINRAQFGKFYLKNNDISKYVCKNASMEISSMPPSTSTEAIEE